MTGGGAPTEPQEDDADNQATKPPFIMTMFEKSKPEGGRKLEIHNDFHKIARDCNELLPEGTVKTMTLERILDLKDTVLRFVR
jgi:hypothetical protein